MAAVLSSCSKSELESATANESKDIVLNISVSNPGADDTKALIKTGWEANDQIKIWFDARTGETPDLVIKYDKTNDKWTQDGTAVFIPTSASGNVKAVYSDKVIVASVDGYTLSGNTLTFSIANWKFLTEVQVVVKELNNNKAGSYTLSCDKFTPLASTGNGYTVGSDAITASTGTEGDAVTGISNGDGVAFVFATADYSSSSTDKKDFAFTLKDNTSGSEVTKVYKPNVAIEAKTNKSSIKALTIANTKFKSPFPDGFVDLGVVVNSKPVYWATKNLGASKPEEYGTYFSWGDTEGRSESDLSSQPFDWTHAPFNGGKSSYDVNEFNKVKDDVCPGGVLATAYDAAYKVNSSWRMPTTDDFKELFSQCYAEWGTYNSVSGLIVYKAKEGDAGYAYFNSKMNKYSGSGNTWNATTKTRPSPLYSTDADTFVFFPAAGRGFSTSLYDVGSSGNYWSSSLISSYPSDAYDLYFGSGSVNPQFSLNRYYGFSVRPVSD